MRWITAFLQTDSIGAEKLGVIGLLAVATVVLWRAYQAKDRQVQALTRELLEYLRLLDELRAAIERLRESSRRP